MTALPYMPLFVADYLADTQHLSTREHGAYFLLIMNYWQREGPLPGDDKRLAAIARLTFQEWQSVKPEIEQFFTVQSDGKADALRWHHDRIDYELTLVAAKSTKARASANARWNKDKNAVALRAQYVGNATIQDKTRQDSKKKQDVREEKHKFPLHAFDQWWSVYPHKIGKGAAEKKWHEVRKAGIVSFDDLTAGLERYVQSKPPERSWCNPATWLHQHRWLDEEGPAAKPNGSGKKSMATIAMEMAEEAGNGSDNRGTAGTGDGLVIDHADANDR